MKQKCLHLFVLLLVTAGFLRAAPPRVVLVFPLENLSGKTSLGWMSEGMASLLASRLQSPVRYVLSREERNAAYEKLNLSPEVSLTLASEYKVAQALGANVAVVGSFSMKGNLLEIQARWLNVEGLRLSEPAVVSGQLGDLAGLETRLAWELVRRYGEGEAVRSEEDFSRRFPPVRLDAFENYIRGVLATDSKSKIHFLRESDLLDPADHRASFELGRYYFEQKDYSNSVRWLQRVGSTDRDYSHSLFLLGISQHFLGYNVLARETFKKLAQRTPLGAVMNNLGVVDLALDQGKRALRELQEAYEKDPENPDVFYNLGACFWRLKNYDESRQYLQKATAQAPDDAGIHTLLAHVLEKLGSVQASKQEFAAASAARAENGADDPADASDPPTDFAPKPRIIKDYDGRGFRRATAARLQKQPTEAVHDDGRVRLKRGRELLRAGRLGEAEQQLAEAVALVPSNSAAHCALGEVYEREGRHSLAAAELEAALDRNDSVEARLWLAKTYISLKHLGPAEEQAQAALEKDPTNAEAKALLNRIHKLSSSK